MQTDRFPRREVERSFRKFNDIVDDLFSARFQTWEDTFSRLIAHCESDTIMQVVTGPLTLNKSVEAQRWYETALGTVVGMIGTGRYPLPIDDEDRTALLYQFLLMVKNDQVDVINFCMGMYGTTQYQDCVDAFNQEIILKFTREVSYRLNEIIEDIGNQETVPRDAMVVFHHHDHSTNIHGGIQGSNVAIAGSTISEGSAAYTSAEGVGAAIESLTQIAGQAVDENSTVVSDALRLLASAARGDAVPPRQVEDAARKIASNSPNIAGRLLDVLGKAGVAVLSAAVVQAIKSGLGMSP